MHKEALVHVLNSLKVSFLRHNKPFVLNTDTGVEDDDDDEAVPELADDMDSHTATRPAR